AILRNRRYTGAAVWNVAHCGRHHKASKTGGPVPTPPQRGRRVHETRDPRAGIVVEGAHAGLGTPELVAVGQVALEQRRWKRTTPQVGGGEWVLSGLLRCGDCEAPMYGRCECQRRQRKGGVKEYVYRKYVCSANFRQGKQTCRTNSVLQSAVV